jgi:hypothetical protein
VDPFGEHAAGEQDRTGRVEGGDHGDDGEVPAADGQQEQQVRHGVQRTRGCRHGVRGPLGAQPAVHQPRRGQGDGRGDRPADDQRGDPAVGRRLVKTDQLKGDGGAGAERQQQRRAGGARRARAVAGADQHDRHQRERQSHHSRGGQVLALHQADTDGQYGGDQGGHGRQHVHRTDRQRAVEQGERGGGGDPGRDTPAKGADTERGAEHRPQQQLDREARRGSDHHRAQHMSLTGTEAAEEIGASVGERAAQGKQQSDHRNIPYHSVERPDRTTKRPPDVNQTTGRYSRMFQLQGW